MFNIFEQPWTLVFIACIAFLAVLFYRSFAPDKRKWWHLLIPVLIAAAGFAVDEMVQSDIEKIKDVITLGIKAVENEDCTAIEKILSDDYSDSIHYSKQRLLYHCSSMFSRPLIEKNILRIISIEKKARSAKVAFTVNILFDKQNPISHWQRLMLLQANAQLEKQPQGRWLIKNTEIIKINRQNAKWRDIKSL